MTAPPAQERPRWFYRLVDWFLPSHAAHLPPRSARRLRFAVGASLLFAALLAPLVPLLYFAQGPTLLTGVTAAAVLLLCLTAGLTRWVRSDALPGSLFCLLMQGLMFVLTAQRGAFNLTVGMWLVIIPLTSTFLVGLRLAIVTTILTLLHSAFMVARAQESGPLASNTEYWVWLAIPSITLFNGGMAWLYEITRQRAEQEEKRRYIAERQRLEKELEIAARIQRSILPGELRVPGLEVATRMMPASEVGGDYYDVLPFEGGCWIAIGDVSGHGLNAGLIMLMLQSMVSVSSKQSPDASPRELLALLNRALFDNIRNRLKKNDYVTLSLIRYREDGELLVAGAGHEDLVLHRARDNRSERVATNGAWVGAMRSIERFAAETRLQLDPGDTLLLVTDGLSEAMNTAGEQFTMERLVSEFERLAGQPVERIRDQLLARVQAWIGTSTQQDDMAIVVLRHHGAAGQSSAAA